LDILFEADLCETSARDVLADHIAAADPPVREYTAELVAGVLEHADTIDEQITAHLPEGWTLQRMPRVDRNVARIAVYEFAAGGVERAVAIAEAVALAADLSTDESPAFLNGVLAGIAQGLVE
jgi:N utilization substance protein B